MIHDAVVLVTCDAEWCREETNVELPYVYPNYSGVGGFYDTDDATIIGLLEDEGWIVRRLEVNCRTYCCEDCVPKE